jgi:Holliday junction resolvase RusA-like endonuclease
VARRRGADEPKPPRILDFCVHGQAVSAQTGRRHALQAWKQRIRSACVAAWKDGEPPIRGTVRLQVTFYRESELGDVDNLLKPIQDALQGVAYLDDRQIRDVAGRRRDIDSSFKVRYMSPALAMAFSDGRHFVHIELWRDPDQEAVG